MPGTEQALAAHSMTVACQWESSKRLQTQGQEAANLGRTPSTALQDIHSAIQSNSLTEWGAAA